MFSLDGQSSHGHRRLARHRPRHITGSGCRWCADQRWPRATRKSWARWWRRSKRGDGQALAVPMDVADAAQVKAGFQQVVAHFGKLDILVNNAAVTRDGLALRMKLEDWETVLRTNLTGAHLCIQQALGGMVRQRSGRIINITSVVAETGNAGQSNYVSAKAGLIGLTRAIAHGSGVAKYHRQCDRTRIYHHRP